MKCVCPALVANMLLLLLLLPLMLLQVFPVVVARASAVSYKPRWVLLLQFPLVLPVSIDVAFVESAGSNCPLDYICRESCRGSGNAQQKSSDGAKSDAPKVLVPLKECGSRDSVNANLDMWVAHASCDWSARHAHLPPTQAVKELTHVFLKVLGLQQWDPQACQILRAAASPTGTCLMILQVLSEQRTRGDVG